MLDESKVLAYPLFQDDFGEPGDRVLYDKIVTAAKDHQCIECLGPIAFGERHRHHVGKYGGEMRHYRYCALCCEAMAEFNAEKLADRFSAGRSGKGVA